MKGAAEINDTLRVRKAMPGGLVLERVARRAALSLSASFGCISLSLSLSLSHLAHADGRISDTRYRIRVAICETIV